MPLSAQRTKAVAKAKVTLAEPEFGTTAFSAGFVAMTKMAVVDEMSLLRVYDGFARYEPSIDSTEWERLAGVYSPNVSLDQASNTFIRRQNQTTGLTESDFKLMFAKLERYIALDTTRNDLLFHPKLYEWLNRAPRVEIENLNDRVYAELFMTPASDKWLGLYSTDIYTALDGNGIVK